MDAKPLPHLHDGNGEGFADFRFRITASTQTEDGRLTATAMATHGGGPVGLKIILGQKWKAATLGQNISVNWGEVTYQSIGTESDRLIKAMGRAYKFPAKQRKMKQEIRFTAVTLQGDPAHCPPQALRMKIFFEPEIAEQYGEVYTNLDPASAMAEIHEKDVGYRTALFSAITEADV